MATATRVLKEPKGYDTSDVVLVLTSDEAIALRTLTGSVFGKGAFRDATDAVWGALKGLGVASLHSLGNPQDGKYELRPELQGMLPGFHNSRAHLWK
jgi:hypothetical protein